MLSHALNQAHRYDVPMTQGFYDILRFTNPTLSYPLDQLTFSDPYPHDETQVAVDVSLVSDETQSVTVVYRRLQLDDVFDEVGLVIDVPNTDPSTVHQALIDTYGIYLDLDHVELTVDGDTLTVTALPAHLLYQGEFTVQVAPVSELMGVPFSRRLRVQEYYATQSGKLSIEWMRDPALELTDHYHAVRYLRVNDRIGVGSALVPALAVKSGLPWVSLATAKRFNLYDARVVYNGPNTGIHYSGSMRHSHVLALELSDLCTNFSGTWILPYSDPLRQRFSHFSINGNSLFID